jgi:hypothetical protein
MTEADSDAIGPDGRVRLRCYLPLEKSLWFFAGCQGRADRRQGGYPIHGIGRSNGWGA